MRRVLQPLPGRDLPRWQSGPRFYISSAEPYTIRRRWPFTDMSLPGERNIEMLGQLV